MELAIFFYSHCSLCKRSHMSSEETARLDGCKNGIPQDERRPMTISLKVGEAILIGDSIHLHFRKIDHRFGASLGIEAPKDVLIYRGEIYKANQAKERSDKITQSMNPPQNQSFSALEEIKRMEAKIAELRGEQLRELKERRKAALAELQSIDIEIAKIIGTPASPASVPAVSPVERQRRRISDGDLKALILKALAEHGANGLSVPEIAEYIGHDAQRIRRFVASNPKTLKQQGAGRSRRYFLP